MISDSKFLPGLILIILFFAAMHMIKFDHRWVEDESWYTMPIPSILEEGRFRIPTLNKMDVFWPQPPLLTYIEAFVEDVFGLTIERARIIPLLFGLGLILAAGLLSKKIWGNTAGLLSAFLVATENFTFIITRTVRPEILVAFFMVLGLLLIAHIAHKRNTDRVGFDIPDYFALFIVFALAVSSHANGLLIPFCVGVIWLFIAKESFLVRVKNFILIGVVGVISLLPFALWIIYFDAANNFETFIETWIGRYGREVEEVSIATLLLNELQNRYADFIQYPYRVHIALASGLAIIFGLFSKNKWRQGLAVLIVIHILFFIFVNNSTTSVRYLTVTTPCIALIWASYIADLLKYSNRQSFYKMVAVVLILIVGVSQLMGNAYYLWRYKDANYLDTVDQILSHVKQDDIIYGAITFWFGLRHHNEFVPYVRMSWPEAVERFNANTVIMNDRLMIERDYDWAELRRGLICYLEHNGTEIGTARNSFYGDMTIYRVRDMGQHKAILDKCEISYTL